MNENVMAGVKPDLGYSYLGNYHIERKIGRGQFSEVYKAIYLMDNKSTALKKVKVCSYNANY